MYEVVPKRYLNKYGGVFTSEIREKRTKKRKRPTKSADQTMPKFEENNIGTTRPVPNPNSSSQMKQQTTYASLFSSYTPPTKKIKNVVKA